MAKQITESEFIKGLTPLGRGLLKEAGGDVQEAFRKGIFKADSNFEVVPDSQEQIQGNIATTPSGAKVDITTGALISGPITPASLQPQPQQPFKIEVGGPVPFPDVQNIPITEPGKVEVAEPIATAEDIIAQLEGRDVEGEIAQRTVPAQEEIIKLNRQIKMFQAESLRSEEAARQMGETLAGSGLAVQAARRESAIKAIELSAISEALQGDFALAERQARTAVNAQFAEQEKKLNIQRNNILNNYEQFTPAEQKRADAVLARIGKDAEFVKEQKAKKSAIEKVAIEAVRAGVTDSEVLQRIQGADSEVEANQIASGAGVFRKPEPVTTISENEIDTFARQVNAGTAKISSVPQNIRSKVVARARDFAEEDLREDTQIGVDRKIKKETLVSQLQGSYPEFSKSEIEAIIGEITSAEETEKIGETTGLFGKVGSFFGSLFR